MFEYLRVRSKLQRNISAQINLVPLIVLCLGDNTFSNDQKTIFYLQNVCQYIGSKERNHNFQQKFQFYSKYILLYIAGVLIKNADDNQIFRKCICFLSTNGKVTVKFHFRSK